MTKMAAPQSTPTGGNTAAMMRPGAADPIGGSDGPERRTKKKPRPFIVERIVAYALLTKPRIVELLLITTVPAMFAAQRAVPSIDIMVFTLIGGALAAGCANALNCVVDADIDEVMRRTRNRPLAKHSVTPRNAFIFAVIIGVVSIVLLAATTTWQAAVLTAIAILFYVLVYSMVLKRRTRQNIVWGGLAGCMPVIIGWSAVTGGIGWPAWAFFGVIFFWTPPHTWALAMRYREDYAAAGVPMLPVVASERVVVRQIVLYSWGMVACSLAMMMASSWLYAAIAVPSGIAFLAAAHMLHMKVVRGERAKPMTLFHLSNLYLTAISVGWAVDAALGWQILHW